MSNICTWIKSMDPLVHQRISSSSMYNISVMSVIEALLQCCRTLKRTEGGYDKLTNHFETEIHALM